MDYAERGTVEKILDELIESDRTISNRSSGDGGPLVADGSALTMEGRRYLTGVLTGILTTVRTFTDGTAAFEEEDFDEIRKIVDRRERELVAGLFDIED